MRRLLFWCFCLLLAGCGGGGGSGSSGPKPPTWTVGVFPPASTLEAKCASPRTGTDPTTGRAYPDVQATRTDENMWLRSWTNDLYLWFDEVPDTNPSPYTTADYFDLLKTSAMTASGNPKDKFHFTLATSDWIAQSQSGAEAGYGAQWVILSSKPPRHVVVAFTDAGTPAAPPGMPALVSRGTEVITVDGVDVANGSDVNTLNNGLFPTAAGQMHTFTVQDLSSSSTRTITMTSTIVTTTPVQNVSVIPTPSGPVGYMLFNDHIATAEDLLIAAINTMRNAAVTDLVLDIRYNGGGFLDLASELAFMIAGPGQTTGKTFEQLQFNAKHPTRDPVTGDLITPIPFHSSTVGIGGPAGQPLPSLDLTRVFVLTGSGTCSASESIINSLRGINVQVIQIGSTTCGKPYGFYPQDNCGTTYFSIQFRGINDKAFGDYTDGFSPQNTSSSPGELIPGCSIADDFTHVLGDPAEGRLMTALNYRAGGAAACGAATGIGPRALAVEMPVSDGELVKSPWRENRILRR
jgi:C-terminal processing protease CtpA/Prc